MAIINGYITEYHPDHPRATTNGMVYQHILKAEEKLGRYLKPEEVVHHINGQRSDNSLDNLLIFATKADHTAFHHNNEYYIDNNGIAHCEIKTLTDEKGNKLGICKKCGDLCSYDADYCRNCWNKIQRKVERPTRNELKEMIRTMPFTVIASIFGVTDNAVRKWCDKYNLPRHSREIKQYSNEEWENI